MWIGDSMTPKAKEIIKFNQDIAVTDEAADEGQETSERLGSNTTSSPSHTALSFHTKVVNDGITMKQMKAAEKLSLYQKGWARQNRLFSPEDNRRKITLLDQQSSYQSPRNENLTSFYEETQRTMEGCPEELEVKRTALIERA